MTDNRYTAAVPAKNVTMANSFFSERMRIVTDQLIPYQWDALNDRVPDANPSYCIRNFQSAAGLIKAPHGGYMFQDSDLAKWIEAAAHALSLRPDAQLEKTVDDAIALIGKAQWPDGYINTYYTLTGKEKRWTDLMNNHELYCAGHMIEAAVAYYKATGKRALVDIMLRFVDHIDSQFGPEEGKKQGYPGHEVIEMALCALYEITGDEKHLRLAKYFIDQRGQQPLYFEEEYQRNDNKFWWKHDMKFSYYQADRPVRKQNTAQGHAVRAGYLYSGMADVARLTNDAELADCCRVLWKDITRKQMYITGAIGQSSAGEAFSFDYDLPNSLVYGETCASISIAFFAERMLKLEPKGEYADVIEKMLYNGALSGMSLDGKQFFYVNPLESWPERNKGNLQFHHVKSVRQKWFGCACCPPNLGRLIASLPGYVWHARENTAYLNLITANDARFALAGGEAAFSVRTDYPWDGRVEVAVKEAPAGAELALRIPGWCKKHTLSVNGAQANARVKDGYAYLPARKGDQVALTLSMDVRVMRANPRVPDDAGKLALMRGPVVYCLEEADNGAQLWNVCMPAQNQFENKWEADRLGGVMTISANGARVTSPDFDEDTLYDAREPVYTPVSLTFIPYYAWANRGENEMCVWVREKA